MEGIVPTARARTSQRPHHLKKSRPTHQQISQQQLYSGGLQANISANNGFSVSPSDDSDVDENSSGRLGLHDDDDGIMNQYERIGDRTSGTSTGSSALSHQQLQQQRQAAEKATHYAESAIYKRSRGGYPSVNDTSTLPAAYVAAASQYQANQRANGLIGSAGDCWAPQASHLTLDRNIDASGVKGSKLLANSLLSSSVHHLLSSSVSPHDNSSNNTNNSCNPLIDGQRGATYEPPATTCLVRTQSGSRFIPAGPSAPEPDNGTLPATGFSASQLLWNRLGAGSGARGDCWAQQSALGHHTLKRNIDGGGKSGGKLLGSNLLASAVQHLRCSWKCSAITFMLLLVALVIALVYLMASSPDGGSGLPVTEMPSVALSAAAAAAAGSRIGRGEQERFMEIYLGRRHSFRTPAYGHWNVQLVQKEPALVKLNFTIPFGVAVGIYGSKNRIPSHTQYDFVEVAGAAPPAPSRAVRASPEEKAASALLPMVRKSQVVEFVRFLDRGTWYISIYNDGPDPQEISLVPAIADESNIRCPYDCRGHGTCVMGTCKCDSDYAGETCEHRVCPVLCSGHGRYAGGECVCTAGWKGKECQLREDECEVADCGGRGDCVDGVCHCQPGRKGPRCDQVDCLDPDCAGHGSCVNGMCLCGKGWKGADCSEADPAARRCLPDCSGHGSFDLDQQLCLCESGWTGPDCAQERCDLDCGPNGHCHAGECVCGDGWTGGKCEETVCDARCVEHGQCKNGTCTCGIGWNGRHCTLEGCPRNCNNHGECLQRDGEWQCDCNPNWAGGDCSVPLEMECNDGRDNDNDGLTDCADSECCGSKECQNKPLCFSSADPLDILLRKQPPSPTASFFQRMQFLIEEDSVQSYAHRQAFNDSMFWKRFNPSRASVIRGQVVSPSGSGLMGVRVGIASDPLLGFVVSREAGWFDIMVNGGNAVVLDFHREPFRSTQRTVMVPWNEIVIMDKVKMNTDERKTPDYKSPICIEHDYEVMKPSLLANWQNTPCGDKGNLLADGQVLHESLSIPGTDLSLVYNSSRASGYRSVIELQLTPDKIPVQLRLVHLKIAVEGNLYEKLFEADPNVRYTYAWNRRNIYRQKVFGVANAVVSVGYEYSSCPQIIWEVQSVQLAGHDMSISEIGGWNLNIHHRYNFHEGILQKGDGSNVYLKNNPKAMVNIMGDGEQRALHCPYCDGMAHEQRLLAPMALASAPDGSIYVGDFNLIRRVAPDGKVSTVIELSASQVAYKYHIAVGPVDGKLYISDPERHQVLRAINAVNVHDPTKNLEVVVGTGVKCLPGDKHHCGDGRLAREAKLAYPKGIAISLNNEMFIADGTNIRMVDTSGTIHTLIGDHHHKSYWKPFPCTGTTPIQKVNLRWPSELAINPLDNSLHILDDHMVLKLTQDKRIRIVAGRPTHCSSLITALEAAVNPKDEDPAANEVFLETPMSIAFSPNGKLFIAESDSQMINRIRVVSVQGKISRYAGLDNKCSCMDTNCECFNQESALASNSKLSTISSITATPDGNVVICDQGNLRLRSVVSYLPQPNTNGEYEIISQESMEVYVFNKHGQHAATKSVLTGKFLYNFTYIVNTSFGKLSSVTDAKGNRVQLLRDYSNQVKEIETSQGAKCRLEMSQRTRMLESFILPSSSKTFFQYYTTTGLIKSKTIDSPASSTSYDYDKNGRLTRAIGPNNEDIRCL